MNRPHGKSLVVFGLSNVLCPYNVLDELITETGVDAGTMKSLGDSDVSPAAREKKIALLKGKSVKAADSLIERLTFTKGASMVCSTLKAMGCRLAILTNTGEKTIADHVKTKLGIDYMMSQQLEVQDGCFTGKFGGDAHDIRFRKLDLIKLMADKEGIEYRNVIVVGESLKGLKLGTAKSMLETFGPNVFFNSNTYSNLAIVLYQLGFSGSHVEELRQRYEPEAVEKIPKSMTEGAVAEGYEAVYVEVSAPAGLPAHIQKVIASLKPFQSQVTISTVRQCSLSNGSTCLGLKLVLEKGATEKVTKELLFACQKASLKVTLHQVPESVQPAACRPNLYVITIVQVPSIPTSTLKAVFEALAGEGVNVSRMVQLSKKTLKAMTLSVALPKDMDESKVAVVLGEVSKRHGCDIAFQKDDVDRFMRRMIVFDMDSTLIQQEVIDELARIAGVETAVKAITESAMRGEIDFFGSLKERCALLKGANCKKLFGDVKHSIQFNPGAERLCSVLRRLGYKMAVLSGGFQPIAEEVARRLRLDYAFANSLEVDEQTGLLTGLTSGPVVTPQRKRALLATISNVEECKVQQTIAVGDGANDIPMLHTAGLGIAFCAKAKVQEVAEFRINQKDLSTVLFLIGLSEHAIERLADCSEADSQGAPLVNEAPGASPKRRRMDP
jgi:phosphoserine phosphatase